MTKTLPDAPNLEHLKSQAKDLLKGLLADDPESYARIKSSHPEFVASTNNEIGQVVLKLADAQLTVAREYGFASWYKLKKHIGELSLAGTLKTAINSNDVSKIKELLRDHPDLINAPIGYGKGGALTWAAECRNSSPTEARLEIASMLIAAGSDVHEGGDGPLMRAALNENRIPMMELLVEHGADVNAQWDGFYPIILAPCETLAPKALQWLIDHGANPNAASVGKPEYDGPLDMAVCTYDRKPEQHDCVRILMAAGAKGRFDGLPNLLIHSGQLDRLKEAIQADPTLLHRQFPEFNYGGTASRNLGLSGATLLHVAAEYGEVEAVRMLLDAGADVNALAALNDQGVGGQTAIFHSATQYRDYGLETTRLLIERGADLTVRAKVASAYDLPGQTVDVTPLGYSARFPYDHLTSEDGRGPISETSILLIKAGAPAGDVYAAAKLGMVEELTQLLASGADRNMAHPHGETGLEAATRLGHAEIVRLLS